MREMGSSRAISRDRGPASIARGATGGGFTTASLGGSQSGAGCVLVDGWEVTSIPILPFLRASEVELVEIYPEGSENSRTLCGRFPPSSGCSCPPEPSGIVVWLKK